MNFSFSAISSFKSCPKSYEFKYLKRMPEAFQTIERHLGSCIHETLRWLYEKRIDNMDLTLNLIKEQFDRLWNGSELEQAKIVKQNTGLNDYYQDACKQVLHFYENVFQKDTSKTLYLEQKFEIMLNNHIKYVGIIDRVCQQSNGTIRLIDYKTGRVDHPLDDLQLPSYALYIFSRVTDDKIELCFEDLRAQRTVVAGFERTELNRVKSELLQEIDVLNKTERFEPCPSILCLWCGFNNICESPHESVKTDVSNDGYILKGNPVESSENEEKFCPECGGELKKRRGKFGPFWGCVNFPDCRYTLDIKESSAPEGSSAEAGEICPECGGLMRERKGKFGPFMGCSNFPDCRFTRKIIQNG